MTWLNLRMSLNANEVKGFFDEAAAARPTLPDERSLGGWGKLVKYRQATKYLTWPEVRTALDLGCNIGHVEYLYAKQSQNGELVPARPGGGTQEGKINFAVQEGERPFVVGVDLSLASLRRAKGHGFDFADFGSASGDRLPFPDKCFDVVICLDVLEHVVEQEQLVREIGRVLRPSGQLFLTTPNPHCLGSYLGYWLYRQLRALAGRPEADKDRFVNRRQLVRWLSEAGFTAPAETELYLLPRPFVVLRGWIITPPVPPQLGLAYQKLWVRLMGLRGEKLPLFLRDRVYHTLVAAVQKQ
jgi:SAM-dependent methyltransferase